VEVRSFQKGKRRVRKRKRVEAPKYKRNYSYLEGKQSWEINLSIERECPGGE